MFDQISLNQTFKSRSDVVTVGQSSPPATSADPLFCDFAESYRDDDADVPDTLKMSFTLDGKPVRMSLQRSDSIPANPPLIISHHRRQSYWSRRPGTVSIYDSKVQEIMRS